MLGASEAELVGALDSGVTPGFRQDDAELLAAVAGEALVPADAYAEKRCELAQDEVPGQVTVCVVDLLEMVDVEQDQRQRAAVAKAPGHFALDEVDQVAAVEDLG